MARTAKLQGIIAQDHDSVMGMFRDGLTDGLIAAKVGVSREAVRRYRHAQNVAPLPKHQPAQMARLVDWRNAGGARPTNTQSKAPEMTEFKSHAGVAFLDGEPIQPGAVDGMQRWESPHFAAQVWVR